MMSEWCFGATEISDSASANLYEATFLPNKTMLRQQVSAFGVDQTNLLDSVTAYVSP
jgi:hypothetical protein